MSEIDFTTGNILLFTDQLRWEKRPDHQLALMRLLIKEEDRFGAEEERLKLAEYVISKGTKLVERQTRLRPN